MVANRSLVLLGLLSLCLCAPFPAPATAEDVRRDAAVIAVEKVLPSVVNIATETVIEYHDWYDDILRQFYGWSRVPSHQQKSMSLGSGVIIDEEGYVLTNFHVVHRASRIQIKLWDGHEYEAEPVWETEGSDVAVLRLKTKPGERFHAIRFAADDDLLLGETVLALGNPYGLGGSVTKGILSSKNRRPSNGTEPLNVEDWLQTDAAINPGNSGGPLVNLRGELIGLNVAVYREEQGERGMGVGFSIPVKQISAALSRNFTPEVTDSLWFGAQVKPATNGLEVVSVQPGSPAAKAGLREKDLVLEVNNKPSASLVAFNRSLVHPGRDSAPATADARLARLEVSRSGNRKAVEVELLPFPRLIRQKLGLSLLEPTTQTAQRLGIRPGEALFIQEVEKDSPADKAGLQAGHLVLGIDQHATGDVRSFGERLLAHLKGDKVSLTVVVPARLGASYVEFRQGEVELIVR